MGGFGKYLITQAGGRFGEIGKGFRGFGKFLITQVGGGFGGIRKMPNYAGPVSILGGLFRISPIKKPVTFVTKIPRFWRGVWGDSENA